MKATSKKEKKSDHRTNQAKSCESWKEGAKQEGQGEHSFRENGACELGLNTQFLKEQEIWGKAEGTVNHSVCLQCSAHVVSRVEEKAGKVTGILSLTELTAMLMELSFTRWVTGNFQVKEVKMPLPGGRANRLVTEPKELQITENRNMWFPLLCSYIIIQYSSNF